MSQTDTQPTGGTDLPPAEAGIDIHTTAGKLADLKRRVGEVAHAGSERAIEKQHARGKKTARERIAVTAAADPLRITEDFFDDVCGRAPAPSERVVLRSAYESALASARSER